MHSKLEKMRYTFNTVKDNENLSFEDVGDDDVFQSGYPTSQNDNSDVLTIEGLRRQYNSCSDCGVCWYDDHVNLDCSQCGGYAMSRPCPICNGQCGSMWRRDVTASHMNKKAEWVGSCSSDFQWNSSKILGSSNLSDNSISDLEHSYRHHHLSPKSKKLIQEAHLI